MRYHKSGVTVVSKHAPTPLVTCQLMSEYNPTYQSETSYQKLLIAVIDPDLISLEAKFN